MKRVDDFFITIPNPIIGSFSSAEVGNLVERFDLVLRPIVESSNLQMVESSSANPSSECYDAVAYFAGGSFLDFMAAATSAGFEPRTGQTWAKPIGHAFKIKHPEVAMAKRFFESNWDRALVYQNSTAVMIWRYLLCLWCHIFKDGNGRLARIFLTAAILNCNSKYERNPCSTSLLADQIHSSIKDQLVIMECQNRWCWIAGTLDLIIEYAVLLSNRASPIRDSEP